MLSCHNRTLAGGHLIVSDPATANKVYDNNIFFQNGPADYSSPVLHTVPLPVLLCSVHSLKKMPLHWHGDRKHFL